MQVIEVRNPATLASLALAERGDPVPAAGEICVRANSLNYHDYAVVSGVLPVTDGRIPMSDGAGEVVAVGGGVSGACARGARRSCRWLRRRVRLRAGVGVHARSGRL